jgi:hypothetical protein
MKKSNISALISCDLLKYKTSKNDSNKGHFEAEIDTLINFNDYKNAFPDKTQKEINEMADYLYQEEINNLQEI